MNALSKLAVLGPVLALVVGGAILCLALWLSWRKPTLVLLIALAALALRPQLLWGGPDVDSAWGLSQSLVVFGLALNALRYGVRRTINWPILALILVLGLNLAFGDLHPKLTLACMLGSLAVLALPFAFTQVMLAPGSRPTYAAVIMLTPLLSVVLAVLLDAAGIRPLCLLGWSGYARFEGATGNAAVFAMLGFSGLVVACTKSSRPGRWYAGPLAALNFALVVLTITRMAVLASLVFALAYAFLSEDLRAQWRAHRIKALLILGVALAALLFCWQTVEGRMFAGGGRRAQHVRPPEPVAILLPGVPAQPDRRPRPRRRLRRGRRLAAGPDRAPRRVSARAGQRRRDRLHPGRRCDRLVVPGAAATGSAGRPAVPAWP